MIIQDLCAMLCREIQFSLYRLWRTEIYIP